MAKKVKENKIVLERTYNVPLRREFLKAPKYKRAKKAITALKQFLVKHMKSDNISIGKYANLEIWKDGIKKPPHHIKVIAKKDEEGKVTAELESAPKVEVKPEPKKAVKKTEEKKEEAKKEEKPKTKEETSTRRVDSSSEKSDVAEDAINKEFEKLEKKTEKVKETKQEEAKEVQKEEIKELKQEKPKTHAPKKEVVEKKVEKKPTAPQGKSEMSKP